jgi:hypothetical protein
LKPTTADVQNFDFFVVFNKFVAQHNFVVYFEVEVSQLSAKPQTVLVNENFSVFYHQLFQLNVLKNIAGQTTLKIKIERQMLEFLALLKSQAF